jgi:hypothetical protein
MTGPTADELHAVLFSFDAARFAATVARRSAAIDAGRAAAPACADLDEAELLLLESRWAMMHRDDPVPKALAALERTARVGDDALAARGLGLAALAHACICSAPRALGRLVHGEKLRAAAESALAGDPDEPFAHFALGMYWLKLPPRAGGSPARAAEHLTRALARFPSDVGCRALLVEAHHRADDLPAASRERDRVRAESPGLATFYLDPLLRSLEAREVAR